MNKPIILSTGCRIWTRLKILSILDSSGMNKNKITVLHCISQYPAPIEEVNLKAMQTISKEFNIEVGLSDHTIGIEVPIAAVAMGADY